MRKFLSRTHTSQLVREEFAECSKGKSPLELTINIEDFVEGPSHFPLQQTELEQD
jgi:hypothetical protein